MLTSRTCFYWTSGNHVILSARRQMCFHQNVRIFQLSRISLTINIQHHLPHGRPYWLMEAKPNLPSSTERVVIALWGGEEGSPNRGVPAWGAHVTHRLENKNSHHDRKFVSLWGSLGASKQAVSFTSQTTGGSEGSRSCYWKLFWLMD